MTELKISYQPTGQLNSRPPLWFSLPTTRSRLETLNLQTTGGRHVLQTRINFDAASTVPICKLCPMLRHRTSGEKRDYDFNDLIKRLMTQVMMRATHAIVFAVSLVLFAGGACAQESNKPPSPSVDAGSSAEDAANAANNPLESLATVDLWDRYAPSPDGLPNKNGNGGQLRVAVPVDTFGVHQFIRAIVPINTPAGAPGGANIGDLTVYDILPFQVGKLTFGAGPLFAAPTAKGGAYGVGQWQAGAAAVGISPQTWGLTAVLATYQHSLSVSSSSPAGSLTTVQPFVFYDFADNIYFRSSGVMTFDTFHHQKYIPIGFGLGKVLNVSNGKLLNLFIEPEYSVYQTGIGSPRWQIFAGLTFKFPVGKL